MVAASEANVLGKRSAALRQDGMLASADPVRAELAFKPNQSAQVFAQSDALTPRNRPLAYARVDLDLQLLAIGAVVAPLGRGGGRELKCGDARHHHVNRSHYISP
jgi:hypothetical protein